MAGSKRGKHSKGKGKSKLESPDLCDQMPKGSNHCLNLAQTSENSNNRPTLSAENDQRHSCPNISCRWNYTDEQLEELLFTKVEDLYTKAKICLSGLGYSERDIENALLRKGYANGLKMDILTDIVTNCTAYLKGNSDQEKKGLEGFESMRKLHEHFVESLIDSHITQHKLNRSDALWILLINNWGFVLPLNLAKSDLHSRDQNVIATGGLVNSPSCSVKVQLEDVDSSWKKITAIDLIDKVPHLKSRLKERVPILAAQLRLRCPNIDEQVYRSGTGEVTKAPEDLDPDVLEHVTSPSFGEFIRGLLKGDSSNPKLTMINDLLVSIRDSKEKVTRQKNWAQEKVIRSAESVSKHLLEMNMLRMLVDKNKRENEKKRAERSCLWRLIEVRNFVDFKFDEVRAILERVRRLENEVAHNRANHEASKLHLALSEKDLKASLKRERRWLKKGEQLEEQCRHLHSQCDEEEKRVNQLQLQLLQIEKDTKNTEILWKQEIKEKERASTCLAEEIRLAKVQKANLRAELSMLRQKLQIDRQLFEDERRRLEDELSSLRLASQTLDMSLAGADHNNLYDSAEAAAFTLGASSESLAETSSPHDCMLCLQNEVSMVFLPCAHQVVCQHCYEGGRIGEKCPYCREDIEEVIRAYGQSI